MRQELKALESRTDLTEEDLQQVLQERDACRERADELEYARCLILLAHVVKWVRSDDHQPPFERAASLGIEAMEIFNRLEDVDGFISAILTAVPFQMPDKAAEMLETALRLARESNDELLLAQVLNRKAASIGLRDRTLAVEVQREAMDIYKRLGNLGGQASCLFSLAVMLPDEYEKRDAAIRSAELSRALNRFDQAARAMTLALVFGPEDTSLEDQRRYAESGLQDALTSGKHQIEAVFYSHLARISALEGKVEEAEKFHRWEQDIIASDGLTPKQREKENAKSAKYFAQLAESVGNLEAAKMFRDSAKKPRKAKLSKSEEQSN